MTAGASRQPHRLRRGDHRLHDRPRGAGAGRAAVVGGRHLEPPAHGHAAADRRDHPVRARQDQAACSPTTTSRSTLRTTPTSTPGLPPTPISNPGLAALKAAANPADVDYLYYVARNDGTRAALLLHHLRAVPRRQGEGRGQRPVADAAWWPRAAGARRRAANVGVRRRRSRAGRRGAPRSAAPRSVIGIIGDPVAHSLSPRLHNAAFAALGLDYVYVPLPVRGRGRRRRGQGPGGPRLPRRQRHHPAQGRGRPVPRRGLRRRPPRGGREHHRRRRRRAARAQHRRRGRPRSARSPSPATRCAASRRCVLGAGGAARAAALALARLGCRAHRRQSHARRRRSAWRRSSTAGVPGARCDWLPLSELTARRRDAGSGSSSTRPRWAWRARVKSRRFWPITLRRGKSYSMWYTLPRRRTSSWRRRLAGRPSSTASTMLLGQAAEAFSLWTGCAGAAGSDARCGPTMRSAPGRQHADALTGRGGDELEPIIDPVESYLLDELSLEPESRGRRRGRVPERRPRPQRRRPGAAEAPDADEREVESAGPTDVARRAAMTRRGGHRPQPAHQQAPARRHPQGDGARHRGAGRERAGPPEGDAQAPRPAAPRGRRRHPARPHQGAGAEVRRELPRPHRDPLRRRRRRRTSTRSWRGATAPCRSASSTTTPSSSR